MQKIGDIKLLEQVRPTSAPSNRILSQKTARAQTLSPALNYILEEVQRELGYKRLESESGNERSEQEIYEIIEKVSSRLGFELASFERDEVLAQLEKSQRPFGILQDLVDDPEVQDIIVVNYSRIDVQRARSNFTTDLSFPSQESYESFVERLLFKAGTTYSTAQPIADGMIGSFARIHAVHKCLCESGPYLTIRLNRFASVTLEDLVKYYLAPSEVLDYLKAMVKTGQTVLVVGEVGTGKTTLVRALAASMPAYESILVIEDTPEIMLEHPHVRYLYTRGANTDGAGRVSPSECIRAGMRMAMNRIIFGEMRDAEAAESFIDVCASGHPGLSTIHARNAGEAVSRLELFLGRAQKGVSRTVIYEQISKSVQVIVFLDICRATGKRRIMEVKELGSVAEGMIRHRDIFLYSPSNGRPVWKVVTKVSAFKDKLEQEGIYLSRYPTHLVTKG